MKKLSLFIIALVAFSCSKNDSYTSPVVNPPAPISGDLVVTTFLPTTNAVWWKYDTKTSVLTPAPVAPATGITTDLDQLNVNSDVTVANIPYKLMKTTATTPTGFYSTMLNNNKLRVDGSSIKLTGNVNFNLGTNSIALNVTDFTIFKENAVAGSTLSPPQSGITPFNPPTTALNFNINYILKAIASPDLASLTVGTITYTNVKVVKLYVNVDAQLIVAPGITAAALDPQNQDVIVSTQYWVKNIGVVKADTAVSYKLSNQLAGNPSLPLEGSQNILETLNSKSF